MTTLSFDVLWRDRGASKGMQDLAKHTDRTSKSFRALKVGAGVALVAAGAAAVKFGISSVKAYVEAQSAQVKLQDAFAKFPKLADANVGSLRKLNTQLALKTKFDDDATASGQAVLAQFGLTGQQLTKLTPLLQDYAAKTGKDLPAAAGVLGKAFLGNTRALRAIGIDYKMTGDKGKDFANIQRLVNEKVGGFAAKEGKSAAGQAAILRNQFGELQESAGKQLLPALLKLGQGLLRVVGFVQANSAIFGTFGKTVKTIFGSIAESIGLGKASFKTFSDFIATHQADITSAIITGGKAFVRFGTVVAQVASGGLRGFGAFADGVGQGVAFILDEYAALAHGAALAFGWIPEIGDKLKAADGKFAAFADHARGNIHKTGDAARGLADGIDSKLIPGLNKAGQGLDEMGRKAITAARARDITAKAENRHRDALDAATAAAKTNGKTLDSNTVSGRANKTALNSLVSSSQNYISKLAATGASSKKVTAATKDARAEFIRVAEKMGVSSARAKDLADKYLKVPKKVKTDVTQPGMDRARNQTKGLDTDINNLNSKKVSVSIQVNTSLNKLNAAIVKQYGKGAVKMAMVARGGEIPGSSPSDTADDVPAMLTSGEWVIKRPSARRYGKAAMRAVNEGRASIGYAAGGEVRRTITEAANMRGTTYNYSKFRDYAADASSAAASAMSRNLGFQATRDAASAAVSAAKAARTAAQAVTSGAPGGKVGTVSRGMAATIAAMRAAGARSFTTYPGHHPSQARARDVTPHSWKIANAARASSSVWYVIYRMLIASKNHGNNWRTYHPTNRRGDWRHVRHVHVGWYDKGGFLPPGLSLAYNGTKRPEPVGGAGGVTFSGPIHIYGVQDAAGMVRSLQEYARRNGGVRLNVVAP